MTIKVMLVDDEEKIRYILKKSIEKNKKFEVICESDNMADALIKFNEFKPQVVFMDIDINGSSGMDCAKIISQTSPDVKIIFATAYAEYMSGAFEIYAFDYLLKPFNLKRIETTLERVAESIKKETNITMTDSDSDKKKNADKILIKSHEKIKFIDLNEIVFVERLNNTSHIYLADGDEIDTSLTMSEFEEKLPVSLFFRSHRSYIINLNYIKSLEIYGRWSYSVKFKKIKQTAVMTKEHYDQLKNYINY